MVVLAVVVVERDGVVRVDTPWYRTDGELLHLLHYSSAMPK